jgi:hypothetical protein
MKRAKRVVKERRRKIRKVEKMPKKRKLLRKKYLIDLHLKVRTTS